MVLDASDPSQVANARVLNIPVSGPGVANRLLIFTGTCVMEIGPLEEGLPVISTPLQVILIKGAFPGSVVQAAAFASLATVHAVGGSDPNNESYFELVDVRALIDPPPGGFLQLEAVLLTGVDSVLLRVNYQVSVLAHFVG